jgi:two-component system, OmpR family, sensor kinase
MSRTPIRLRVTAASMLALAVVLAAAGLFLYLRLGSHLSAALDGDLQLRADDLATLVRHPETTLAADPASGFIEHGERYAQLLTPDGRVLDATRPLDAGSLLTPAELRAARRHAIYVERRSVPGLDEPSRILARGVTRDGRPVVLAVGATLENRAEMLSRFRDELLIAGPVALLLGSGIAYLLAGVSLRQVESMRRRAAAISADNADERLPVAPTGDELERLGTTLNAMLDRLEAGLERERAFVADAGHELRTPLALLRTEIDLALHQGESRDELREALRNASSETERLSRLAESLLLIARSDRGQLALKRESIDIGELFASVFSRVEWRTEAQAATLSAQAPLGARISADRLRLEQALGNLLDNALRHGGTRIRLVARPNDGEMEIHVLDDGPGFPPDLLSRAFERFARADPARGRGGAGLGLSIVRTIAAAHDGSAHAANTGAGADVWISIPV